MGKTELHYDNYIFDLYGTLIDIRTDEEDIKAWEKMALLYRYYGAAYEAGELRGAYVSAVHDALDASRRENGGEASGASRREYDGEASGTSRSEYGCEASGAFRREKGGDARPEQADTAEIRVEAVFRRLYEDRGVRPDEELVLWTCRIFRIATTVYIRLFPQVKERLRRLRENGARTYLLTNAQRVFTENELRIFGLEEYFDGMIMSSDKYIKKPDRRFYQCLIDTYGLDPARCLMSGDDAVCDVAGARNAGMDGYLVKHTPARRRGQDCGAVPDRRAGAGHAGRKVPLV